MCKKRPRGKPRYSFVTARSQSSWYDRIWSSYFPVFVQLNLPVSRLWAYRCAISHLWDKITECVFLFIVKCVFSYQSFQWFSYLQYSIQITRYICSNPHWKRNTGSHLSTVMWGFSGLVLIFQNQKARVRKTYLSLSLHSWQLQDQWNQALSDVRYLK